MHNFPNRVIHGGDHRRRHHGATPRNENRANLPPLQQIPYLPPEIITDILSRLPVQSLLQFRSVSKPWRSIISDPKFVKTHLKICSKNDEIAHHRFILFSLGRQQAIQCHLSPVLNGFSVVNPTELDYPMKQPDTSLCIVGSVNGLVCISVDNDTFFWNPSTRISKKLPHSGFEMGMNGFGYDESTDDYRLVGSFRDIGSQHGHNVMVYSLRTDCWRRICDFPSGGCLRGRGKCVNGAIHWAAGLSIISLDLARDTYGEVAQPSYGDGRFALSLGVLRECLSVLCDYESHGDVWMMKDYGVRESWTKLAHILFYVDRPVSPRLLHISKNAEILLQMGGLIWVYDPKTNFLRNCEIPYLHFCLGVSVYAESIVSPLIQEVQERRQ